jgi:signal transduction histidine kinase/ActR/RegA family two-component response regulator
MSFASPDSPRQGPARASWRRPWERSSLRAKGLMLIAIPLLPLVVLMSTLLLQAREDVRSDERITELRRTRDAAEHLLSTAVDAETGIRGYVATGNPEFLEPFDNAMANLIGLARTLTDAKVSPEAQALLEGQYELLLALRREGPALPAPRRAELLLQGKENMDSLREAFGSHIDAQRRRLASALEERDRLHRRTEVLLWGGGVASLVAGAIGVFLFVREIAARVRLLQENSRLLGGSEPLAKVRGNDEIATLGNVLEATRQELAHRESLRREAEKETIRSRDEAERANTAKSEFLSRMSHELRTPLNAILGFAQLLEMDSLNADQRENVHQIVRGGNHLLDLINEVLDISRVETGRLSISVEPIPLSPLIDETVALVRPLADAEGIELRAETVPGMERQHVMADAQRLKQILLNLLSNAIKYNRPGGSIDLVVNDVGENVCIEVRDTGGGLSEEQLANLFTPFDRLGAEGSEVEGTGLGLALSKGLAEAMGAGIRVSSEVGTGTTFFLDLSKGSDPNETSAGRDLEKAASVAIGGQVRTVLYIEDNLSNLTLVESILEHRPGVRLLTAMEGRAGLDLALHHDPDLVLLDLNLPDLEGGEVLRILRADVRTSSIPVVIVSADATERQIASFKGAGALDYLTKPIDVQRFLRVVDRALAEAVA